jgi:hypothetical protein
MGNVSTLRDSPLTREVYGRFVRNSLRAESIACGERRRVEQIRSGGRLNRDEQAGKGGKRKLGRLRY